MEITERQWAKVTKLWNGCWIWSGATNPRGYGNIGFQGKTYKAHRYFYECLKGPIPEGLTIDHLCRTPLCVNPAHMEPVTNKENNRRGYSLAALRARQTECVNGHPFDEHNTVIRSNGTRMCRACTRSRQAIKAGRPVWGPDDLTTKETARILGINAGTLYHWADDGYGPPRGQFGRYRREDVEEWLANERFWRRQKRR